MKNKKLTLAVLALLIAANVVFIVVVRQRRKGATAAGTFGRLRPLAELAPEERRQLVADSFSLDDFRVRPSNSRERSIIIPRPMRWWEQQIVSATSAYGGRSLIGESSPTDGDSSNSQIRNNGDVKVNVVIIGVVSYQAELLPGGDLVQLREMFANRDASLTKNGIHVPLTQFFVANRYVIDVRNDSFVSMITAAKVNGHFRKGFSADVPVYLMPSKRLTVGDTWKQVGVNPPGVSGAAPPPTVVGKVNRLVIFEDHLAAEISSVATCYSYESHQAAPRKVEENRLGYFDLETGEPLWYQLEATGEGGESYVVRSCNQKLTPHLLRPARQ